MEEHKARKQAIYRQYQEAFADIPEISMNPLNPDGDANNWLSCMTIARGCSVTPDEIMDALDAENIESRPIWKPMHEQLASSVGQRYFCKGIMSAKRYQKYAGRYGTDHWHCQKMFRKVGFGLASPMRLCGNGGEADDL